MTADARDRIAQAKQDQRICSFGVVMAAWATGDGTRGGQVWDA
jgi:hypothetical protein